MENNMELKRYDNLTIEEVYNLYADDNLKLYDGNWFEIRDNVTAKEVNNIVNQLKNKLNNTTVDINYREKYIFIKKYKNELILKLYEFYKGPYDLSIYEEDALEKVYAEMELELQIEYENCMVRRVREKYPELVRKYQKRFVEHKEEVIKKEVFYEENTSCEFPIEVIYDMAEEEMPDLDIYKEFGYWFEGLEYSQRLIDVYFQMECNEKE